MLSILLTAQTTQQSRSFIQSRSARLLQSGKNTTTTTPHMFHFCFFSERYTHILHTSLFSNDDKDDYNDDINFE